MLFSQNDKASAQLSSVKLYDDCIWLQPITGPTTSAIRIESNLYQETDFFPT